MDVLYYNVMIPIEIARVTVSLMGERILASILPKPSKEEEIGHVQKARNPDNPGRRSIFMPKRLSIFKRPSKMPK